MFTVSGQCAVGVPLARDRRNCTVRNGKKGVTGAARGFGGSARGFGGSARGVPAGFSDAWRFCSSVPIKSFAIDGKTAVSSMRVDVQLASKHRPTFQKALAIFNTSNA